MVRLNRLVLIFYLMHGWTLQLSDGFAILVFRPLLVMLLTSSSIIIEIILSLNLATALIETSVVGSVGVLLLRGHGGGSTASGSP